MTRRWHSWVVASWVSLGLTGAWANPHRLDDTGTYTVPPVVRLQWRERPDTAPGATGMEATMRVQVRIDTQQWIGRRGRIYLVLARDETHSIEARWTTQGRLLPGRLQSGERALVWAGTVAAPTLEDQLQMALISGADWQASTRRLNFHFEFDAD
jgi:hypothetical protein